MASRGWVYWSKESAGRFEKFHENCDCQIVPSWDRGKAHLEGYDPDALYGRYSEARGDLEVKLGLSAPLTDKMIADRMAELQPAWYTNGVIRDKPTGASEDGTLSAVEWAHTVLDAERKRNSLGDMASSSYLTPPGTFREPPADWPNDLPELRAREWNHLLYGESKKEAGGHLSGYGWQFDRSEFPASWNEADVARAIETVLREAPVLPSNSRASVVGSVNGVQVLVGLATRRGVSRVTSAYPIGWD